MRNAQVRILSISDATSATGSAIDVGQSVSASFVVHTSDTTATGTVKLQASNQPGPNQGQGGPTIWADIPNATSTIASGTGPAIVIGNMCFSYIRVVYTSTIAGSGIITVDMNTLST